MGDNQKKTESDLYQEQTDDYVLDIRKHWDLPKSDQKYDAIPQIWEGKNIADYIDPEIEEKLAALLAEEEEREASGFYDIDHEMDDEATAEIRSLGKHIAKVKNIHMQKGHRNRRIQVGQVDQRGRSAGSAQDLKTRMQGLGLPLENWDEANNDMDDDQGTSRINAIQAQNERMGRKRKADERIEDVMEEEGERKVARSKSRLDDERRGLKDGKQHDKAIAKRKHERKTRMGTYYGQRNEGDRHIATAKPKHLFSGKRGIGSTDRR